MSTRMVVLCSFAVGTCMATLPFLALSRNAPLAFATCSQSEQGETVVPVETPPEPSPSDDKSSQSDAERIGELQESLEHDKKQLSSLEQEIENPNSEYAVAEKEFRAFKDELTLTNEE